MAVIPTIDLTAAQCQTVLSLLSRYLPNTTVWAYGSRVKWASYPTSDLDLVAFAKPEQSPRVAELREAFDESNLPFRVDLFVWDDVPESFRKRIKAEHVVLEKQECGLSKGWPEMILGDCIEMNDATYTPREKWPFINYLDTSSLTENRIEEIQHLVTGESKIPSRARRKVRAGDMLYSTVRPNQRHFGILKKVPENFLASTGFAVIRGKKDCAHTDFIYWFLAQDSVVEHLHTIAEHSTSAYPSIRPADVKQLRLNLPSLPEQRAIARILGTLDDKIELNRRMIETVERAARAVFESWFRGQCSVSPNIARLDDLIEVNPAYQLGQGDIAPYLDMANTPTKSHIPHTVTYRSYRSGARFQNGDTLVARITPCLENGKAAYIDFLKEGEVGWGSTEFVVMRPKHPIPHEFAYCLARDESFRRFAILNMTGTSGRQRVSAESLATFPVPVPSPKVCRQFGQCARPLFSKARAAAFESRALANLRDALLPKLLSGKIRIPDAEKIVETAT